MNEFLSMCIEMCTTFGGKIIAAIVVLLVGRIVIRSVQKALLKSSKVTSFDQSVQSFVKNIVTCLLYALLIITVISILGIPMASIVAVLASCGLAVGLSLQGALTNIAGYLMILVFKPFRVGDYISASGADGTVRDITFFYTTITTVDNKRITVPNGSLMNSNITNFSSEELRRVDLDFKISNDCDFNLAKGVLLTAAEETSGVLQDPAPFARLTAVDDDTYIFTVRAWCKSGEYWNVYFDTLENCSKALAANGIDDPEERIAIRMVNADK